MRVWCVVCGVLCAVVLGLGLGLGRCIEIVVLW